MTDIFISYARKDREIASRLAVRLEAEGWTVFWDRDLLGGEDWRQRLEAEARSARCVVALWSDAAIKSGYVLDEATIGLERSVLAPALLEPIQPPFGFRGVQASDLTGWGGPADTPGLANLIGSIAAIIGHPITIWPLDLVIVVGRPKIWRDLGPTVNLTCKFVNELKRKSVIRWLEASAVGPEGRTYRFAWKVLYDAVGLSEHKRYIDPSGTLEIPAGEFHKGIQFQAPTLNNEVVWPSGGYKFQLRGWADRNREEEPPNLKTEFEVSVPEYAASEVKSLLAATDAMWEKWKASDDARGVRVQIKQVRAGRPAARALSQPG